MYWLHAIWNLVWQHISFETKRCFLAELPRGVAKNLCFTATRASCCLRRTLKKRYGFREFSKDGIKRSLWKNGVLQPQKAMQPKNILSMQSIQAVMFKNKKCLCMCVCLCKYTFKFDVCAFVNWICTCICICIWKCICLFWSSMFIYVYLCVCAYLRMCVYMYACMCVCMHACICVYVLTQVFLHGDEALSLPENFQRVLPY